ncbi:MAG: HAMP domain-containing histidine kinase [Magnetococcales bacterium]|nr:HAMP domain-containing histidine kinase [Magnetococcales bacterium]
MEALHAQLDLNTAIFFLMAFTALDGLIALLIWNGHRQMQGLATIATGFLSFGVAVWMLPATTILWVTVRNTLFNVSQALATEGMAQLLGKPRLPWLPWLVAGFSLLFWPWALLYLPAEYTAQIRTIVSSLLSIILVGRMLWLMLQEKKQTRLLHYVTIANQCLMILTVLHRLYQVISTPWNDASFYSAEQAWFYFLLCLEANFMFVCQLIMVGENVARQLHQRHAELSSEVQLRSHLQRKIADALAEQLRIRAERHRFLQLLGHEISTPLAAIDRSAEMIQNKPESMPKRIPTIRSAIRRLFVLTQDLLLTERFCLELPKKESLEARQLLQEAIDQLEASGAMVELQLQGGEQPLPLPGDREMLLLALHNVLHNAVKYSTDAAEPVQITLESEGAWLTIRVEDSGIGFLESELQFAKQQFFRGSNVATIPGNGLGLYIVDQIIKNHGGTFDLANREGGGAAVTLRLPV